MKLKITLFLMISCPTMLMAQDSVCRQYTDEKIANYWQTHFEKDDPKRSDSIKNFYFLADEHKVERMAIWATGHGFQFKRGITADSSPEPTTLKPYYVIMSRPLANWQKEDFWADMRSLRELLYRFDPEWCGNGGFGYKP